MMTLGSRQGTHGGSSKQLAECIRTHTCTHARAPVHTKRCMCTHTAGCSPVECVVEEAVRLCLCLLRLLPVVLRDCLQAPVRAQVPQLRQGRHGQRGGGSVRVWREWALLSRGALRGWRAPHLHPGGCALRQHHTSQRDRKRAMSSWAGQAQSVRAWWGCLVPH